MIRGEEVRLATFRVQPAVPIGNHRGLIRTLPLGWHKRNDAQGGLTKRHQQAQPRYETGPGDLLLVPRRRLSTTPKAIWQLRKQH
jgi:hypothetical protein